MKKLKNLLLPAAITLATVATVTPVLVSCNEKKDTEIVQYTVDRDTDCLYGLNKNKERIELTDDQLDKLEGCYLITKRGMSAYILVDAQGHGSDGKEYPKSVAGFIADAQDKGYLGYELFLINGRYELDDVEPKTVTPSHPNIWLNGIMGYDGQMLSELDCVPGESDTPTGTIDLNETPFLGLRSLKVIGCDDLSKAGTHNWSVTGVGEVNVEWSYFYGTNIFTVESCTFESTWFNSADVKLNGDSKTDYALWLFNTYNASFTDCHFYSRGKAIKVYLPTTTGYHPTRYLLDACDFHISTKGVAPGTSQNKFCFEVNNKPNAGFDADHKLQVWYADGTITGDYDPTETASDPTKHGGMIGSLDTTEYEPTFTEITNHLP